MQEIELRDWDHFKEYASSEFGGQVSWVFRGHGDRNWKLESTLTRLAKRISDKFPPTMLEKAQLQNFRMRIRGLRGENPQPLDENGLWSLGQHYGLCTPLLDWTESIYVAAYFAFEKQDSCRSGWRTIIALNKWELQKNGVYEGEDLAFLEPLHDDNKRITAQAGLFTKVPTNTDLESWMVANGLDEYIVKIHIEDDYRLDVINDLRLMNIVGSSIYPDLHGAATACNMLIETQSENFELQRSVKDMMEKLELDRDVGESP